MSKSYHFQVIDLQQPSSSMEEPLQSTDWSKCFLCQQVISEILHCSAKSKHSDVGVGQGYSTLARNLMHFNELNNLPMPIDPRRLDEGNGIEATLLEHEAKWYKSCHTKFNSTQLSRAEKRKLSEEDCEPAVNPAKKYICRNVSHAPDICFFGKKPTTSESLHEVSTYSLETRVRKCAHDLRDERLLAILSAGDMIAQDAKYHSCCLVSLYNLAASVKNDSATGKTDEINQGIALTELVAYIEDSRLDESIAPVFKHYDLTKLYSTRLQQLGVEEVKPHSTRIQDRILAQLPHLRASREGQDILLTFNADVGPALHKTCDKNFDDAAVCLVRAAKIVRRDKLKLEANFTGSFDKNCQIKSVRQSLLALVSMILNCPIIKSQEFLDVPLITLSVAKLLQYKSSIC